MSDSGVATLFKMLTYLRVCSAFSSGRALLSNMIRGFETVSETHFDNKTACRAASRFVIGKMDFG